MTKAYDMENLQHNDCSYSECIRLIKNGISEKFVEPKNIEWIDSDGYTCSTWRIGYKEKEEKAGMSLAEAKAHIEQRNKETISGYPVDEFLAKQYK